MKATVRRFLPPIAVEAARALLQRPSPALHGGQRGPDFYDANADSPTFSRHYTESQYYPVWAALVASLAPLHDRHVLEIGCGTGQLAELLVDHGLTNYLGFDFSRQRIAAARGRTSLRFEVADAFDTDLYEEPYDTVVCTEFLEHVDRDLDVLRSIRSGVRFVGTVPSYSSIAHVRHFPSAAVVIERYSALFEDLRVSSWRRAGPKVMYLMDGTLR